MSMTRPTSEQVTHEGRLLSGVLGNAPVNVKAYGATGDGVTDDTVAVQAALDAAAGGEIVFAPGTYLVYALKVPGNTTVNLATATVKKRAAVSGDLGVRDFTGSTFFSNFSNGTQPSYAPIFYLTGNDIVIKGGTIDGNRANDTLNRSLTWGGSVSNAASRAGILVARSAIPSCSNLTVDGVRFVNMVGTAMNIELDGVVRICNCTEQNAGHVFVGVTSDATTFLTAGTMVIVENNRSSGDRQFSGVGSTPTANTGGLDRFKKVIVSNNVFDESLTAQSAGLKLQDSDCIVVTGNVFLDTYAKPQCAPSFVCKSMSIAGNTFVSNDAVLHVAGIANMNMPCRSLAVSGNSFVNALCQVERSSDSAVISGNSFQWTIDPNLAANGGGTIGGGNNKGPAGKAVISGNSFDGGGFNGVHFFRPPDGGGVNIVSGNLVMNTDTFIPQTGFVQANIQADTEYHIVGNTILNCRAIGRIVLPGAMRGLVVRNNYFGNVSSLAPNNLQTSRRNLHATFSAAAYTVGSIVIEGNTWDESYGTVVSSAVQVEPQNAPTVTTLSVRGNEMRFAEAANGMSVAFSASSCTFTNVHVQDNYMLGDFQFSSGATVTNEYIGTNQFGAFGSTQRKITNLTQKAVGMTGTLTTTVGSAGAASALPATPTGYVTTVIDGTARKVPYYAS